MRRRGNAIEGLFLAMPAGLLLWLALFCLARSAARGVDLVAP